MFAYDFFNLIFSDHFLFPYFFNVQSILQLQFLHLLLVSFLFSFVSALLFVVALVVVLLLVVVMFIPTYCLQVEYRKQERALVSPVPLCRLFKKL